MKYNVPSFLSILVTLAVAGPGVAQQTAPSPVPRPTLTLSPAVALAKGKPGQGWSQSLQMSNFTSKTFRFDVEVQDVVVKDGKRIYVPAGETEGGIAITAVASPRSVVIPPQQEGQVTVTLTMPMKTAQRAVVIYFRGKMDVPSEDGSVGLGASLGALLTFDLSEEYKVEALGFSTTQQTDAANLTVSHELVNSGREVVVPKGAVAILDESGRLVSKAVFDPKRLLPGERLLFTAPNPSQLKPGHYRAVSSFEYEGKVITATGEFSVP
jgi:hypothetical protein